MKLDRSLFDGGKFQRLFLYYFILMSDVYELNLCGTSIHGGLDGIVVHIKFRV